MNKFNMENYNRLNLVDGDVLKAADLCHFEDCFEQLCEIAKDVDGSKGVNVTDLSSFETHYGLISSTGAWANIKDTYLHVVVPVSGESPTLTMTAGSNREIYYAGVKEYTEPVSGGSLNFSDSEGWNGRRVLSKTKEITVTVPHDVKYLIFVVLYNSVDTTPAAFSLQSTYGGGKVSDLDKRISALENPGINWIALGDSITEGFYSIYNEEIEDNESHRAEDKAYAAVVARLKGFNLTNKGVGGSGWLKRGSTQAPKLNAREQIDATNEDGSYVLDFTPYDLCTIAWGVNDWKGKENLGSFEDGLNPETESVYANMRYCLETIQRRNPNMKIIVIGPVNCRVGTGNTDENNYAIGYTFNGKTLDDFCDALKHVCEYYGIEYIDMLHTGVINRLNIVELLPDKVHPSLEAHVLIGKELAGKISFGK